MTQITDPKLIRQELQALGYKAHGKKCRVVLIRSEKEPVEAIIHCKDVPTDKAMCWYFCQDECDGTSTYAGDKHCKKYAWCFWDDSGQDEVHSFEWIDKQPKKPEPRYTIHPKTVTLDGTTYNAGELDNKITQVVTDRDQLNDWLRVARNVLTKIS